MGTTLTGTTPQDTYDSLIKVTDNGPIGATPKLLSDGLGNDSSLALSTTFTAVRGGQQLRLFRTDNGIYGSIEYLTGTGGFKFDDANGDGFTFAQGASTPMAITAAGNVGIGTSSPSNKLSVGTPTADGSQSQTYAGNNDQLGVNANYVPSGTFPRFFDIIASGAADGSNGESNIRFFTNGVTSTTKTEKLRILANGGITFNGDTAAANALDDYEEGTWTMGVSFGGASAGVTYLVNTGTYTKIGRQVTVNGYLILTSKGSSTGNALITGLPFTVGNSNSNYAAASIHFYSISFANQMFARVNKNSTDIFLAESTEAGVFSEITDTNFANDSEVMVLATYFV